MFMHVVVFGCTNLILLKIPYYNIMHSYSTIAWVASIGKGKLPDVDYGYKAHSTADGVFNFMLAMGEVAFSYAGHNVVLEIQATIPSTPETFQESHVERSYICLFRSCLLLSPCGLHWILYIWQLCRR